MTAFSPAELDQVKALVDLVDLAGQRTSLRKIAANEYAGPCPVCGGRDRFHVNAKSQTWMCSNCTGREKWGDVSDYRRFLTGETFPAAVEALGGRRALVAIPVARRQPEPPQAPKWTTDKWQNRVQRLVADADRNLDRTFDVPGRKYLAERSISLHTAYLWKLGYMPVSPPWNDEQKRRVGGPSLTLPYLRHDDKRIMAVRYRRIDPQADRYINEAGSDVRLFGLHLLKPAASTLIVVEGELNAISIWQAAKGLDLTVVSIGGQSVKEQALADVGELSAAFTRCIVWCDEAEKSQHLRAAVTSPVVQMRRSPKVDGQKIDANDMLQQRVLGAFLARVLDSADYRQPTEVQS